MRELSYMESVVFDEDDARRRLSRYLEAYPHSNVQDIYVWFHQSIFCSQVYEEEHILEMAQSARAFQNLEVDFPLFEPVGFRSEFVRVNIYTFFEYGAPLRTLQDLTDGSKRKVNRPNIMQFKTDWEYFNKWVEEKKFPGITLAQIKEFDREMAFHEHLSMNHSERFENYYSTFYKVVDWALFSRKFPEFEDYFDQVHFLPKFEYDD